MSITAGVFMSDTELTELNLFTYPGSLANDIDYAANYALTDIAVTGDRSDSGKSAVRLVLVGSQLDLSLNQ